MPRVLAMLALQSGYLRTARPHCAPNWSSVASDFRDSEPPDDSFSPPVGVRRDNPCSRPVKDGLALHAQKLRDGISINEGLNAKKSLRSDIADVLAIPVLISTVQSQNLRLVFQPTRAATPLPRLSWERIGSA